MLKGKKKGRKLKTVNSKISKHMDNTEGQALHNIKPHRRKSKVVPPLNPQTVADLCPEPMNSYAKYEAGNNLSRKFTIAEIAEPICRYNGHLTTVARELGITLKMLQKYINNSPTLQEICREVDNSLVDLAENKLYSKVEQGDMKAILFVLRCKGRNRGWVEATETNVNVRIPSFVYQFKSGSALPKTAGRPQITQEDDSVIDVEQDTPTE